jgi:translocation and assembly module TamA
MDDSLYFSTVEVQPGTPDRETLVVPVTIRAVPARRDRYSFGLGYGTDTGGRGTVTWDRSPVNRKGHRVSTELKAAERAQSLRTRYIVPIGDPALDRVSIELNGNHETLADLDTRTVALRPGITRVRGRWQWETYVSAQRTTTIAGLQRTADNLLVPGIAISAVPKGYLGEALYTRAFYAELRGSHSALGSSSDFLQLRVQSERVFDLAERWHMLVRGDFGASIVAQFSQLPGSFRYFAGGDRSVRGFGYNELSPVQRVESTTGGAPAYIKIGGKHLVTGTVELVRDLRRNIAVAAFVDGGNAFDTFRGLQVAGSAGVGVRWRLPAVTVGIDIAQAFYVPQDLKAAGLDPGPRLHVNFSPQY